MKFNKTLNILLLAAQALLAQSEEVSFKVLSVDGTPVVNVGGQQHEMTLDPDNAPLYKVKVNVDQFPVEYNYIVTHSDGTAESEQFMRKREKDEKALNDFFNRSITIKEHPLLPRAYEAFPYFKPSRLYDDNSVATILVECDPAMLQKMYADTANKEIKIQSTVTFASPYSVKVYKNAVLSLSGQSTRSVPKLSYTIKNLKDENNKELYDRTTVKLRAEHMDPSFLRDKLYGDVLNSLGVPAAQNKLARLFINNEPIGLFNLSDDITSGRYLRETFNKGEKYPEGQMNPIFKADYCPSCPIGVTYGDLCYYTDSPTERMYAIYTYKGDDETADNQAHISSELIPLLKEISDYGAGTVKEMSFDIDTFLRYMAMELVSGAVDNYWVKPGNFYVFKDLSKNKWYFHDSDFHYTFGVGGEPDTLLQTTLANYPPLFDEGVTKARGPLDAIRSRPENEANFHKIFERLFSTALHPDIFYPRLQSLAELIKEDVEWDFQLPKVNPNPEENTGLNYSMDDFNNHINGEQAGATEDYPIRYFLNTKINNLCNELGIKVPAAHLEDLGTVENPSQAKKSDSSSGTIKNIWNTYSLLVVLLITFMLL